LAGRFPERPLRALTPREDEKEATTEMNWSRVIVGWMNVWWIIGIVVVLGVLRLVLKSFGRRTPPAGSS
jgi:hypothetical protein